MSTRCDAFEGLLARAADGTLDPPDQARLDGHLATCPACAEALVTQREMRAALHALAGDPVRTQAGARVVAMLRAEAGRGDGGGVWLDVLDWRRWTWRLAPVAAALAVAVATVSRPVAPLVSEADVVVADDAAGETRPASAALVTGEVTGEQLLQLLLSAGPDAVVPVATTAAGGGQ